MTRAEKLERKRIAERLRYAKIKSDPELSAIQTEKERLKYLKKKEKWRRTLVPEMPICENLLYRKMWRNQKRKSKNLFRQVEQSLHEDVDSILGN